MVNNHNEGTSNGWGEWGKFVLKELERLNTVYNNLLTAYNKDLSEIKRDLGVLNIKSGVWGLIGGLIPVLITVVLFWMTYTSNVNKQNELIKHFEAAAIQSVERVDNDVIINRLIEQKIADRLKKDKINDGTKAKTVN